MFETGVFKNGQQLLPHFLFRCHRGYNFECSVVEVHPSLKIVGLVYALPSPKGLLADGEVITFIIRWYHLFCIFAMQKRYIYLMRVMTF